MKRKKGRVKYKKGQFVICKYRGDGNGDLIVARVDSVRSTGDVVLVNLLSDPKARKSIKAARVLLQRNCIVPKAIADRVVMVARTEGQQAARTLAADLARARGPKARKPVQLSLPRDRPQELIAELLSLAPDDLDRVARAVWPAVISVLGVA